MKRISFKTLSVIFSLFLLSLLTQNCSPGKYAPQSILENTSNSGSDSTSQMCEDGATLIDDMCVGVSPIPDPAPNPNPIPDPPPNGVDLKPAFVANGAMGRTLFSCDEGRSWINDRSDNTQDRCWEPPNNIDCDHTSGAARGITIHQGNIYANFGWGAPGTVRKTTNGVDWVNVLTGGNGGGLGSLGERLLVLWGPWQLTSDEAMTWTEIEDIWNIDHAHMAQLKTRLAIVGRENGVVITEDGMNFFRPQNFDPRWVAWAERKPSGGLVEGNNNIVIAASSQGGGGAGRSTDGGRTWSPITITSAGVENMIHTGSEFLVWTSGRLFRSANGLNWTSVDTSYSVGPIAYNPSSNTFVWISNHWTGWYEQQRAYRSSDGVNWTQLTPTNFRGGHMIEHIQFGMVNDSICP